jgi:hypothetical protein
LLYKNVKTALQEEVDSPFVLSEQILILKNILPMMDLSSLPAAGRHER